MKTPIQTLGEICLVVLVIFGALKLLELAFVRPSFALQSVPVVNVTVNLPESQPKELNAGDHIKGLCKIAWDKTCEKLLWWC